MIRRVVLIFGVLVSLSNTTEAENRLSAYGPIIGKNEQIVAIDKSGLYFVVEESVGNLNKYQLISAEGERTPIPLPAGARNLHFLEYNMTGNGNLIFEVMGEEVSQYYVFSKALRKTSPLLSEEEQTAFARYAIGGDRILGTSITYDEQKGGQIQHLLLYSLAGQKPILRYSLPAEAIAASIVANSKGEFVVTYQTAVGGSTECKLLTVFKDVVSKDPKMPAGIKDCSFVIAGINSSGTIVANKSDGGVVKFKLGDVHVSESIPGRYAYQINEAGDIASNYALKDDERIRQQVCARPVSFFGSINPQVVALMPDGSRLVRGDNNVVFRIPLTPQPDDRTAVNYCLGSNAVSISISGNEDCKSVFKQNQSGFIGEQSEIKEWLDKRAGRSTRCTFAAKLDEKVFFKIMSSGLKSNPEIELKNYLSDRTTPHVTYSLKKNTEIRTSIDLKKLKGLGGSPPRQILMSVSGPLNTDYYPGDDRMVEYLIQDK